MAGGLARGVTFGLFVLAFAPLILVTPAHATDDNTVSIAVDQNAALKPAGNLYKATTNVTVKTGKPYGFNLTMQADTADLVNSKDSTRKISAAPSSTPVALNANQWGYSLDKSATTFSAVPAGAQATPAVVADVTKAKPAGCTNPANCTKQVTFAANVDPAKLASGSYSTSIIYTATAKPKPAFIGWEKRTAKIDPSEVCRSGDDNSSCLVDLDKNMIPVKYTGTTTNAQWISISNPEDENDKGNWYDYGKKQWANAVTVKKEALTKYQGKDRVVDQADILGFWVYIPRYAYEVMRRDGTDKPVKEQNFDIKFENTKTPKKRPLACKTGNGKDYRTECGVSRELPLMGGEVSTWTTHPAFSFGKKELNGIWFAKFETTGLLERPTVLPNEAHIDTNYINMTAADIEKVVNGELKPKDDINPFVSIGNFYYIAKSFGLNDANNVGGNKSLAAQNNHHLTLFSSRMVNNNDWGAATYLSASKYGAGYNGVQANSQSKVWDIEECVGDLCTSSTTGCGPLSDNSDDTYNDSGNRGTQSACSNSNLQRAYNGTLGQLASTTNNPTGVYDMSGGSREYVAASYSSDLNSSATNESFGSNAAHPPYVNNYNFEYNINSCTFDVCGGQGIHETYIGSDVAGPVTQWNKNDAYFVTSSYMWLTRGGSYKIPGLFAIYSGDGRSDGFGYTAFRVTLGDFRQD